LNPRKLEKLSGQILRCISGILEKEISDPRLHGATVNRVLLSGDGSSARVYISKLGSPEDESECSMAMGSALPFIRRRLAAMMETRTVPALHFIYDSSIKEGEEVLTAIRKLGRDSAPD
jgi:ribosome-binding factor A